MLRTMLLALVIALILTVLFPITGEDVKPVQPTVTSDRDLYDMSNPKIFGVPCETGSDITETEQHSTQKLTIKRYCSDPRYLDHDGAVCACFQIPDNSGQLRDFWMIDKLSLSANDLNNYPELKNMPFSGTTDWKVLNIHSCYKVAETDCLKPFSSYTVEYYRRN